MRRGAAVLRPQADAGEEGTVMVATELLVDLREYVGRPSIDEVNDRKLLTFLNSALDWLANELQYNPTVTTQALTLDDYDYVLGVGVSEILWVRHGTKVLVPASIELWLRGGGNWR